MSGHTVIPVPHPDLKTLSAAMKLRGPKGMCFHRSVALCLDLPGSSIVVATLRAATPEEQAQNPTLNLSKVPFIHAWVEFNGAVIPPSYIERAGGLILVRPRDYYETNGARDIRRLPRSALVNHVVDERITRELLYGIHPGIPGYLVGRLLNAVGVKYLVTPQGGVIPIASGTKEDFEWSASFR
jgi:hypothetical protein